MNNRDDVFSALWVLQDLLLIFSSKDIVLLFPVPLGILVRGQECYSGMFKCSLQLNDFITQENVRKDFVGLHMDYFLLLER